LWRRGANVGVHTIIQNEFVSLWYYEEEGIVHHKFHKFLYGEPFREALTMGLEVMETHGAVKWLSDDRNNAAIPQEDRLWSATVWRPRAVKSGWKYWALLLPTRVTGQMSMQSILNSYAEVDDIVYKLFENTRSALDWLKKV
jgi:hypothetical protein